MNLSLKRPLAIFDLETTGLNITQDRIVEIAVIKAYPDGSEEHFHRRINPEMAIPNETSLIHGIYDQDIVNEPTFSEIADELVDFIGDADLAGYNSNKFDIPVLSEELLRVGNNFDVSNRKFVDVQNGWQIVHHAKSQLGINFGFWQSHFVSSRRSIYQIQTHLTLRLFGFGPLGVSVCIQTQPAHVDAG